MAIENPRSVLNQMGDDYRIVSRPIDRPQLVERPFGLFHDGWIAMGGGEGLARKRDFDIMDFWPIVEHLMLLEWLSNGDFLYRVVGGHIVQAIGFDATGKRLSELGHRIDAASLNAGFTDVVRDASPKYEVISGRAFLRDWQAYERMLVPLADEAGDARFILGCVEATGYLPTL